MKGPTSYISYFCIVDSPYFFNVDLFNIKINNSIRNSKSNNTNTNRRSNSSINKSATK